MHPDLFAVDNTVKDKNIEQLVKTIREKFSKQEYWGEEMPLSWLALEETLKEFSLHESKPLVRFEDVASLAKTHHRFETQDVEDFLVLYNALGEVIFFRDEELRDLVILKPQWLIDALKCFITIPKYKYREPGYEKYWKKLDEGILDDALIQAVWGQNADLINNKKYLLSLMRKFDLIQPLHINKKSEVNPDPNSDTEYVIPCLLHPVDPDKMLDNQVPGTSELVYAFRSENQFFPDGLFHRLIPRCREKYHEHCNMLFYDYACFIIDSNDEQALVMSLKLIKTKPRVCLEMKMHLVDDQPEPPKKKPCIEQAFQESLVYVRRYVEEQLHKLKQRYFCPDAQLQYCIFNGEEPIFFTQENIMRRKAIVYGKKCVPKKLYKIWFTGNLTSSETGMLSII